MKKNKIELQRQFVWNRWQEHAKKNAADPKAVIRDIHFRNLSNHIVSSYLNMTDLALDAGCGNGYATAFYSKFVKKIIGFDYTPQFIKAAEKKYSKLIRKGNLEFSVGDVLDLAFLKKNKFDKVITERTLINLPSWEDQKKAILNFYSVLKPKGLLLMTEITLQGHAAVDKIRKSVGLDIIEKYPSNIYLDEPILDKFLSKYFIIKHKKHFGAYTLISKIIHPLLVAPKPPKFDAKINRIADVVSRNFLGEDMPSHNIFYVLEKR
ncbi:MAG: methylase involved in ubiquinone/menaquinone biosynthesis [Candidatus Levybacteria bacterium]|nr:methylase involved in ubiquinone/menaquinone biosynthesis [Candidatus Levybacteria bacterium]